MNLCDEAQEVLETVDQQELLFLETSCDVNVDISSSVSKESPSELTSELDVSNIGLDVAIMLSTDDVIKQFVLKANSTPALHDILWHMEYVKECHEMAFMTFYDI